MYSRKSIFRKGKKYTALQEAHNLYFSAKKKYLAAKDEEKTKEASELMLKTLFVAGRISEEYIEKWQSGKIIPTNKELNLLREGCDEVLKAFDSHFKKELLVYQGRPFDIHHAEVKEKVRKIRNLLEK